MNILWFLQSSKPTRSSAISAEDLQYFMGLRIVVWALVLVLALFGLWAHWAVLDQITRAQGSVVASSKTQVIQSMDGGTIASLHVRVATRRGPANRAHHGQSLCHGGGWF